MVIPINLVRNTAVRAAGPATTRSVPNGLAFSEFRGYEDWQSVGPRQTDAQNVMRLITFSRHTPRGEAQLRAFQVG